MRRFNLDRVVIFILSPLGDLEVAKLNYFLCSPYIILYSNNNKN